MFFHLIPLLFEKGLIRNFIKENKYDYIIKTAIINHNRFQIEEGLDEKTLLHSINSLKACLAFSISIINFLLIYISIFFYIA